MRYVSILVLGLLLGAIGQIWGSPAHAASAYPVKPISFIVPMGPGSDLELTVRPLLQKASDILGKPVVIVNKEGAAHSIGYREIHAAKPDGYTIGGVLATIITNKMQGLSPYDYRDFTPICLYTMAEPLILASTKTKRPFSTIQEVFAFAKSHPGEVSLATTSVGQTWWIGGMLVQEGTGLKFNIIPQEAGAGMVVAQVAGGHADLGIAGLSSAKAQIDAGNLRILAVVGTKKAAEPYHAPTLREVGYDVVFRTFSGIIGPPKMPKEIVDKLVTTFEASFNDPAIQKHILARNSLPSFSPPDQTFKHFEDERKIYERIMEKVGMLKRK